mgnify:CR=1 FL=1
MARAALVVKGLVTLHWLLSTSHKASVTLGGPPKGLHVQCHVSIFKVAQHFHALSFERDDHRVVAC